MAEKDGMATQLNFRMEPKTRYLLDLACQITEKSITNYIHDALRESFNRVNVEPDDQLDVEPSQPFTANRPRVFTSLAKCGDGIWDRSPLVRIQLLMVTHEHLLSDWDRKMYAHILTVEKYRLPNDKLDRKAIEADWKQLQQTVFDAMMKEAE